MLRPHIGKRPPFSPNGHSGAPYLGESGGNGTRPGPAGGYHQHRADRPVGEPRRTRSVPAGAPVRTFNVVGIPVPIQVTSPGKSNLRSTRSVRSTCSPRTRTRSTPAPRSTPVSSRVSRSRCAATSATASPSPTPASSPTAGHEVPYLQDQHPHPPRPVRHAGIRRRHQPASRTSSRSGRTSSSTRS